MSGAKRGISPLLAIAIVAVLLDIALTLRLAPEAANFKAPLTQHIFYYHVPAAWVAYLAFAVTAAASARYLWRGGERWDHAALASAEVGLTFSIIALLTGLVWSRQEFGLDYDALTDAKVITLIVVILAYAAYLALRRNQADPQRRARTAAVYGVLAFLAVPLSYFASKASLHPDFLAADSSLDPALGVYLLASTIAFTLLYAALVQLRARFARIEAIIESSEET